MPTKPKKQTLAQALKKIRAEEPCKSKPKGKRCINKVAKAKKDYKQGVKRVVTKKSDPSTQLRQNINIKIGEDKKPVKKRKTGARKTAPMMRRDDRFTQGAPAPQTTIINVDGGLPDAPPQRGQYGDRPVPPGAIRGRGYEDPVGYADEVARRAEARHAEERARHPAGRRDGRNVAEDFVPVEARRRAVVEAGDEPRSPRRPGVASRALGWVKGKFGGAASPSPGGSPRASRQQALRGVTGGAGDEDESKGGQQYFTQADADDARLRREQAARGYQRHAAGSSLGGGFMNVGNIQHVTGVSTGAGAAYPGADVAYPVLGQREPLQDSIGNPSGGSSSRFRTGQARNGVRTGGDPSGSGGGGGLLHDGVASSTSLGHQNSGHARLAHVNHASEEQEQPQPRRRGRPKGARTRPAEERFAEQQEAQLRREQRASRGGSRLAKLGRGLRRMVGGGRQQQDIVPYGGAAAQLYHEDASIGGDGVARRVSYDASLGGGRPGQDETIVPGFLDVPEALRQREQL